MTASESIGVESGWPAVGELHRLLEARQELPNVTVSVDKPSHRNIDPQMAFEVISGSVSLLAPFVTMLAARTAQKSRRRLFASGVLTSRRTWSSERRFRSNAGRVS